MSDSSSAPLAISAINAVEIEKQFDALDPVADSTHNGYKTARKAFNIFAELQQCKKVDEFEKEDFLRDNGKGVETVAREYATFLLSYQWTDGKHFKVGTALQYLSGWKSYLSKKFPDVKMLREKYSESEWYDDLYVSNLSFSYIFLY